VRTTRQWQDGQRRYGYETALDAYEIASAMVPVTVERVRRLVADGAWIGLPVSCRSAGAILGSRYSRRVGHGEPEPAIARSSYCPQMATDDAE
jgi:hypothetical protein